MKASIVDLRYKMKQVLQALDRNELITILYHGQEKAIMTPIDRIEDIAVDEHPFFGMHADKVESVEEVMDKLRGSRY